MKTIEKIEKCSSCDGEGWKYLTEYNDGEKSIYGRYGCSACGGSGEEHESWYIKYYKEWGCYNRPREPFRKGSGKVKRHYKITDRNCSECNGTGKARYKKDFLSQPPFAALDNQREYEKWLKKNTVIDKCRVCDGLGKYKELVKEEPYGSSGCFLSTACIEYKGLSDDCVQLQTLRYFRDTYVSSIEGGKEKLRLYYIISPLIVIDILKSAGFK